MSNRTGFKLTPTHAASLLLLLSLCLGPYGGPAAAARESGEGRGRGEARRAEGGRVSERLRARPRGGDESASVEVIIQLEGKMSGRLNSFLNGYGARVRKELREVGAAVVSLPWSAVAGLEQFEEISYVTPDEETRVLGHVSRATGADAAAAQTYSSISQLNGTGVGLAVIDSGIYDAHAAFLNASGTASRVVYNQNFVPTEARTDDPYGHGTHVAGLAAGNDRVQGGAYRGVAPDANLVDLRVLDAQGKGRTSWLLAALDWVAANHRAYNVRVVNLSLGTPAIESWKTDPVCRAVERLYDLDIVVVAAAGNHGRNAAGQKVYGQIHAPGNSPHAVTVGAANSFGTDTRADDAVTTFSSRGPTRSYTTDAAGARRYDHLLKPDLVAPGNKLVSAESYPNKLRSLNPALSAYDAADQQGDMMYLSGTSMAAPLVSGTVALMFEVNPRLTAGLARTLLQYTATPLKGFNLLEQGAGQLNVAGAARLADLVRRDLAPATAPLGAPLLTAAPPAPQTYLNDRNYAWAQGITFDYTFGTGVELITKLQEGYRPTYYINNDVYPNSSGLLVKDASMLTAGVAVGRNVYTSGGGPLGTGVVIPPALRGSGVILTDGVTIPEGVVMGDGVVLTDGVVMGDAVLLADGVVLGDTLLGLSALLYGDATA
jgi:subtilisin family serine protease